MIHRNSKRLYLFLFSLILILMEVFMVQDVSSQTNKAGDYIPDFYANDQDGDLWSLKEHLQKGPVVLYFYPAAMTGGCT